MSEEITQNQNADPQDVRNTDESENKTSDKTASKKSAKERKAEKKTARADAKEQSRLNKEWEDSIVASKRVKREENRRKLKRAMLILLVFALIVTSIVYVMLLFIQENNVRITANSRTQDKAIALSMDDEHWTPYLNAQGPETLWDISYNKAYGREQVKTIEEVTALLEADDFVTGAMNGKDFICFTFMLKNVGDNDALVNYEMTLENDQHNLQNAVRIMWGESYKSGEYPTDVKVYAALSDDQRLAGTNINVNRTSEDGFIEYLAYPVGSDNSTFDLIEYESTLADYESIMASREAGYIATEPFFSNDFIFKRETQLAKGDIMYCYVCIWLEGSDFDCIDKAIGGYCKLAINFEAT